MKKSKAGRQPPARSFNELSGRTGQATERIRSSVRFSLGLRISLNYAGLLLRSMLSHLFLFALTFALLLAPQYAARVREAMERAPSVAEGAGEMPSGAEYASQLIAPDGRSWGRALTPVAGPGALVSVDWQQGAVYLRIEQAIEVEGQPHEVVVISDLTGPLKLLMGLLAALVVLELLRVIEFIQKGRSLNQRLLKPISDITETAQALSGSNLSMRINVNGIKNELKELALVINEMLDRIEVAYNSQKQFVSDASHELRTPIAVIQGYADLLSRWGKEDPEVLEESIEAIQGETSGMKELVEKLLFLARHDKRTWKLEKERFDVSQLVDELSRDTVLIAGEHEVAVSALEPCEILGDRGALKQAIRVFVENALKYTPAGGRIALSCRREGRQCRITVSDNGPGISAQDLPRIFDRFYRADAARNGDKEGHGLGLAIARIIVLSHGGKIEVESKLGKGSRFHVLLPL